MSSPREGTSRLPTIALADVRWLSRVAALMGDAGTLAALAHSCEQVLARFTDSERDGLYLFDYTASPPRLRLLYARGFTEEERQVAEATAMDRHPGWVVRTGQALWVPDTHAAPPDSPSKDSPRAVEIRSRLWLPVAKDGEVFGAFGFASARPHYFADHDREVLAFVAELAAIAYQRIRAVHVAGEARRRAAAAEEEAARHRFSALLGAVPDAIVGTDVDGRVAYWNRGAAALLGRSEGEMLGTGLAAAMPAAHAAAYLRALGRAAAGEALEEGLELELVHADGRSIPVELRVSRVEDRGEGFLVGVFRDLTPRKRAEAEHARAAAEARACAEALLALHRGSSLELAPFLALVTETVAAALDVDRVSVWDLTADAITCRDLYDRGDRQHQAGLRLPEAAYPAYFQALRGEEVILAEDARRHPTTSAFTEGYLEPLGIVSMLDVPLRALDGIRGVMCVEARAPRAWRPAEIALGRDAGALVVNALDREARRQLEARHAVVLASIGEGVIACDPEGRITLLNPIAEHLTGWASAAARGRPLDEVLRLVDAATRAPAPLDLAGVLATGQARRRSGDVELVGRDGRVTPVSDGVAAIVEDGAISGAVVTFRDVTEELRVRREIELRKARLRSISEAIPDLLFAVALDGRIRFSQTGEHPDLLVPAGEASSQTIQGLFAAETAAALLGAVGRAIATAEVQSVEYALDLPVGRRVFEARMARLGDDEVTVLVRNVTDDRARVAALREERARLATLLESTSAIVYAARLPGFEVDYVSESAVALLGRPVDAPGAWEGMIHPDDRGRVREALATAVARERLVHEYRVTRADGEVAWLHDEVRVVRDEAGRPLRLIGAAFDVTARKEDERRLTALVEVQGIVSELSRAFLAGGEEEPVVAVEGALRRLAAVARGARVHVYRAGATGLEASHQGCAEGVAPRRREIAAGGGGAWLGALAAGRWTYLAADRAGPGADADRAALAGLGLRALVACPMIVDGAVRGAVVVDDPQLAPLRPEEFAAMLQLFADALAAGLKRLDDERALRALNAQLTRRGELQRAVLDLSLELARTGGREALLDTVQERLRAALGATRVSVAERDGDEHFRLRLIDDGRPVRSTTGALAAGADPAPVNELAGTSIGHVLATGQPVSTVDLPIATFRDWSALHQRRGHNQFVVVPLMTAAGTFATLNIAAVSEQAPGPDDIAWIAQFGAILGAHLARQDAEEARVALLAELEDRVVARTRELRASEERFELLFRNTPQALLMVDPAGRVVQSNRSAQVLFGYAEGDLHGLRVGELIPAERRAGHDALMRAYREAPLPRPMAPGRVIEAQRRDGGRFFAEVGLVPLEVDGERLVLVGLIDVSARLAAQAEVQRSLAEKETLLKEIHHRVKNNLQIISSLLMLQSDKMPSPEARAMLEESVYRVRSMALIHQQLYGVESLSRIDLGAYARTLAESLRTALAPDASLDVRATVVEVTVEQAVPLGLILNELLTNAFKYGAAGRRGAGEEASRGAAAGADVRVEIASDGATITVTVADSGPGLPPGFDPARSNTLGLQLVRSLTRQLRATVTTTSGPGSRFAVACPARPPD